MDDDDDDEYGMAVEVHEMPADKASPWIVAGATLELIECVFAAVSDFFGALSLMSLSHFRHQVKAVEMHEQATREIEMLTQGD